jgi:hypothetical protein
MGEEGSSYRYQRMIDLLESVTHRWIKLVCKVGFKERNKATVRGIIVNQEDRRTDLEVCRDWIFVDMYSQGEPLS